MYDAVFYVQYPYYYPHFLPISRELEKQGKSVKYILSDKQNTKLITKIAEDENLDFIVGEDEILKLKSKSFFFANAYSNIEQIDGIKVFLEHGIGTKTFPVNSAVTFFDYLLVEGDYRYNLFRKKFPQFKDKIKKVGFTKLDPIINAPQNLKDEYFNKYNLATDKPTILYAPTFFPASIEKMSKKFPEDFKEYNIIVKAHYISLSRSRYKKQQKMFKRWATYDNCHICDEYDYDLTPFLGMADIMISDESSAIFEFTALDKPVILNKFLKLRLSYYLNPKKLLKRFDKGMDRFRQIGDNAKNYKEMVKMVHSNMANKNKYSDVRKQFMYELCGKVDGKVSQRVVKLLKLS